MTSELNPEKRNLPKRDSQKASYIVFCVVCAVVIGVVAWISDPLSPLEQNADARDSLYNLLVQGFKAGQLNLIKPVPPGLAKLSDPYNPNSNAAYVKDLTDISYYKGKFYVYFGVTPVLILYLPYTLLTGHYLSDKVAVIVFFTIGFLMMMVLMRAIWRRYLPTVNPWMTAVVAFGLSLALALTLGGNKNEAARTCGFAFGMLALCAIWCAMHSQKRRVLWLALASLAYGLAIGARPSLLFGIIILLIPVAQAWFQASRSVSLGQVCLLLATAVVPVMLVGLGLALYNDLRFDNPFEFGWHYQLLNYEAPTARQYGLNYLWFNIRYYYFEPLHWSSHFPFLQGNSMPSVPSGYFTQTADPVAGILINYPAVLAALAVPWVWTGKPQALLRWFIGAIALLFATCVMTLCVFFTASKAYEMDFLPPLLLLTLIGILGLESRLAHLPVWRAVARWALCLSLIFSIALNLLENTEAHAEDESLIGNSFLSAGQLDEALTQYQKALALWPECSDALNGVASVLLQKGRMDEAIVLYQKALEIRPNFPVARNNLGYCFLKTGRMDDAIVQYENVLETRPDLPEARNNLAYCYLQIDRVGDAIIQYQKAIELEPQSAVYHCGLGNAFLQGGEVGNAAIEYQKALQINPVFPEAHSYLAYCLFRVGKMDDAIVEYRKAIQLKPGSALFHSNFANALLIKGNVDEAIVQYEAAISLEPKSADICKRLGDALFQKRRTDDAINQYQKALEINPNFPEARNNLGYCFLAIGRVDDAIIQFQKAIELQPGFVGAYKNLGDAYRRKGMADEAVASYQEAIKLQPQLVTAQNSLAWILATWPEPSVRNGKEAVALAEKANELSGGNDPQVIRTLAAAYAETGDFPKAVETAKKALALAGAQSDTALNSKLQTEIGLYESNSPCRSTNN